MVLKVKIDKLLIMNKLIITTAIPIIWVTAILIKKKNKLIIKVIFILRILQADKVLIIISIILMIKWTILNKVNYIVQIQIKNNLIMKW